MQVSFDISLCGLDCQYAVFIQSHFTELYTALKICFTIYVKVVLLVPHFDLI